MESGTLCYKKYLKFSKHSLKLTLSNLSSCLLSSIAFLFLATFSFSVQPLEIKNVYLTTILKILNKLRTIYGNLQESKHKDDIAKEAWHRGDVNATLEPCQECEATEDYGS